MDILLDARRKAEAVVQDMSDPDLRRAAFQVILKHLLEQSSPPMDSEGSTVARSSAPQVPRSNSDLGKDLGLPRSAADRILVLRNEDFFQGGRGIGEIRDELQAHGWMYALTAISGPLMKLVRQRQLRRMMSGEGKKKNFKYFNP
jgi:hypothetical protein